MGEVKERPILFSGQMVLPVLAGLKTQTRRAIRVQPGAVAPKEHSEKPGCWITYMSNDKSDPGYQRLDNTIAPIRCPYGQTGDRLWVREAWKTGAKLDALDAKGIAAKCLDAGYESPGAPLLYLADGGVRIWGDNDKGDFGDWGRYRHARFMPRWASRITLEVTEVRVQRLQDITEEDCIAEGARWQWEGLWWTPGGTALTDERNPTFHNSPKLDGPRAAFGMLWESINGIGSWNENPWVWCLSFSKV